MNILIITPDLNKLNGVALHFKGLYRYWKVNVVYFIKAKNKNIFIQLVSSIKFIYNILKFKINLVVLNVSLKRGFYSQLPYLIISKVFRRKQILFIHGWDISSEYLLKSKLSNYIFNNVDAVILLSSAFKEKIDKLYSVPVYLTTTKVDDSMVDKFNISKRDGQINRFLYVSRVEKEKGIFLVLEIFKLINDKYSNTSFHIVGDGSVIEEVKEFISNNNIKNVVLKGRLEGQLLCEEYANADFFFLLSLSEGIPAALLEAMAFGLPIATRPVGGIPDFFIDNKMGILSESLEPNFYCEKISSLMQDTQKVIEISNYNYQYAKQHFMASKVAQQMEAIFEDVYNHLN